MISQILHPNKLARRGEEALPTRGRSRYANDNIAIAGRLDCDTDTFIASRETRTETLSVLSGSARRRSSKNSKTRLTASTRSTSSTLLRIRVGRFHQSWIVGDDLTVTADRLTRASISLAS
jgi:hypothetical protein